MKTLLFLLTAALLLGGESSSVAPVSPPSLPMAVANPTSLPLPEGNHRVTITFGDADRATTTTVWAESRQLMLEDVHTEPGQFTLRRFIVNIRTPRLDPPPAHAPGATAVELNEREQTVNRWDDQVTLAFTGPDPDVRLITVESVPDTPTVYLIGDSTVTDQPSGDYASWGQMLPRFFDGTVAIANHAESGETIKSFIFENRLNKVLSTLRAGDTVLIQFGHNDQKKQWPQTYLEATTTWPAYLRTVVAEIKRREATPVLVTSMERRTFTDDGRIRSTHGDYPQTVREVAASEGVTLIDLQAFSVAFYEGLGPDRAPLAFANHGKDATHHNAYGAYQFALAVAHGLKDSSSPPAQHLRADLPSLNASNPSPPEEFRLSLPNNAPKAAPRGN